MSVSEATERKQKVYHTKATGAALATVEEHSAESDLKLYGGCFCPFVQRVWIALELTGLKYQYIEVDPYKKPKELVDINPRGLVPALSHGDWGCYESTVLMEYVNDIATLKLLPLDPKKRAYERLWADHVSRNIVPNFYRYLQAQDSEAQANHAKELEKQVAILLDSADPEGPFFNGPVISFVDIMFAPWILRLPRVLGPYRGWQAPPTEGRFGRLIAAIENNASVQATTSSDELYLDSYERYAENRPNTSQVANAINAGRGLP